EEFIGEVYALFKELSKIGKYIQVIELIMQLYVYEPRISKNHAKRIEIKWQLTSHDLQRPKLSQTKLQNERNHGKYLSNKPIKLRTLSETKQTMREIFEEACYFGQGALSILREI
ncbi:9385_t:CDS:2, partial [Dentiscutata heterogama]